MGGRAKEPIAEAIEAPPGVQPPPAPLGQDPEMEKDMKTWALPTTSQ